MLRILGYEMCDAITDSDHRPVSASIKIFLPKGRTDMLVMSPQINGADYAKSPELLRDTFRLMKIRFFDLDVKWVESEPPVVASFYKKSSVTSWFSASELSVSHSHAKFGGAHSCMVYFPLPNEDPLAAYRKTVLMNQALGSNGDDTVTPLTARNMKYVHNFVLGKSDVMEVRSVVCPAAAR